MRGVRVLGWAVFYFLNAMAISHAEPVSENSPNQAPSVQRMNSPEAAQDSAGKRADGKEQGPTAVLEPSSVVPPSHVYSNRVPIEVEQGIGVQRDKGDSELRVVTRTHTGLGIGLQVVTSILVRGVSAHSFSKENLNGDAIKDVAHPAGTTFRKSLEARIDGLLDDPNAFPLGKPAVYRRPLYISSHQFLLVYTELDKDDPLFELHMVVGIAKKKEKSFALLPAAPYMCSRSTKSEENMKLKDWETDNYQHVRRLADKWAEECAEELSVVLPTMLSLK